MCLDRAQTIKRVAFHGRLSYSFLRTALKPLPGLPSPDPLRGRSSPSQHLAASESSTSSANLPTKMHKTALSTSTQEIQELVIFRFYFILFFYAILITPALWERNLSQSATGKEVRSVCGGGGGGGGEGCRGRGEGCRGGLGWGVISVKLSNSGF